MTDWQTTWRRVSLSGVVTTGPERAPERIRGVTVRMVTMPEALSFCVDTIRELAKQERRGGWPDPDRTRTAADGSFFFLDLPAGSYELVAESTRPDRSSTPVSVELEEPPDGDRSGRPIPHVELQLREPRNRS